MNRKIRIPGANETDDSSSESPNTPASELRSRRLFLRGVLAGVTAGVTGTEIVETLRQNDSYSNELSAPRADIGEVGSDISTLEITREAAERFKQLALDHTKASFKEAGYSGAAQSDNLHTELENPKARLTIDLGLNPGKHPDILALEPYDLEGFTVAYASLSEERTAESGDILEGDETRTPMTVPSIGHDESTRLYFKVSLWEGHAEESPMVLPEYDPNDDYEKGRPSVEVPNESSAGYAGPEGLPISPLDNPSGEFYPENTGQESERKFFLEIIARRIDDDYPKQDRTAAELLETAFSDFK